MKVKLLFLLTLPLILFVSAEANESWDEDTALTVLATDTEAKALACQALARVGGPNSVPMMAELLGDEKLASYARTVLEVIKDPSAGEALIASLPNLNGRLLAGAVTSLGVRGDQAAIPAIQDLASHPDRSVADAAMIALARIGTEEALAPVFKVLRIASDDRRIAAAHALLLAADLRTNQGQGKAAKALLEAVKAADLPDHIKQTASMFGKK